VLGDQFVCPRAVAIVDRDAEAFSSGVAGQIRAHCRQAENSEIGKVRHRFSPFLSSASAIERPGFRAMDGCSGALAQFHPGPQRAAVICTADPVYQKKENPTVANDSEHL
jgi:hypothetical protein